MFYVYGYRERFKREGSMGHAVCENCGHDAQRTLCRQIKQVTFFWIPVLTHVKQRGIMCESCGQIIPLGRREYKEEKSAARDKM